ncbi:MAG: DUF917 domain-containing protein [Clostridia bacterium]|nr:DUF917 domain-containing protein [Candidatus Pelethousia sp.]NCB31378.1 DUF917 domain-containing protein [Clostridia bacterium]
MKKIFTLKNRQDVEDFVHGCSFYGTGGGGDYAMGVDAMMKQLKKGNEIGWVDSYQLNDGDYSCCPFLMGSIAPEDPEVVKERETIYGLGPQTHDYTQAMVGAIRALEDMHGKKMAALVPIELGGANTAACVCAAAEMGIAVVDGDYTGRAIPEIQQTTPFIFERELLPVTSFDCWGNVANITGTVNWRMTERIGKMIAAAGYSKCAQAGFCFSVKEMNDTLMHGTLSDCFKVGRAMRKAVEEGRDPAQAAIDTVGGWIVFRGKVTKKEWWDKIGYYWGTHTITGEGKFAGEEFAIWFKNENHMSWKNGKVFITSPDMLQVIDTKTGEAYTNNKIQEGMDVTVIAMKARDVFRSQRGLFVLSPKAFGFDTPYVPAEQILGM